MSFKPAPVEQDVRLDAIETAGGTQMRVRLDEDVVADYAERMMDGVEFPPIVLFQKGGSNWLADGFHRFHAARNVSAKTIRAIVHAGDRSDAIEYAIGANKSNGLRRTNADKQMAVRAALAHERLREMSDREIARLVGVSNTTVSSMRNGAARLSKFDSVAQQPATTRISKPVAVDNASKFNGKETGPEMTPAQQKEKVIELHGKGLRLADVASAIGVHVSTVRDWLANPDAATRATGSAS